ncbi:MAG TPA: rRNA maturation RNase YbeY [Spirochaetes bacterium]|nr:rRNA maturation RNase YbeY [Spirochaetota bacterium]
MDFNIYIKRENRGLPVSLDKLDKLSCAAFELTGKKSGDISLVVCDDGFIRELNKKYKGIDGPTDVLSFSMREGEKLQIGGDILGDIVISVDTAQRQARVRSDFHFNKMYLDGSHKNKSLQKEFLFLFTHGLLHLLGYTHGNPEREKIMMDQAKKLLSGAVQTK